MSDGVVLADSVGTIVMLNDAACAILGVDAADARTVDQLDELDLRRVDDTPLPVGDRPLRRALRGEAFADEEALFVRAGQPRHVMTSGTSVVEDGRSEIGRALGGRPTPPLAGGLAR